MTPALYSTLMGLRKNRILCWIKQPTIKELEGVKEYPCIFLSLDLDGVHAPTALLRDRQLIGPQINSPDFHASNALS